MPFDFWEPMTLDDTNFSPGDLCEVIDDVYTWGVDGDILKLGDKLLKNQRVIVVNVDAGLNDAKILPATVIILDEKLCLKIVKTPRLWLNVIQKGFCT